MFKQFKLANGDEIIAKIVGEPQDEEDVNLVVQDAFELVRVDRLEDGYRYYIFKPWMTYQNKDGYFQLLNYVHIIGEAKPDAILMEQYRQAVKSEREYHDRQREELDSRYDELMAKLEELTGDSDDDNVIAFNPRDKMH